MNECTAPTEVRFVSSQGIRAARKKRVRRRRLVIALFALPKIAAVVYVAFTGVELIDWVQWSGAELLIAPEYTPPFVP